MLDFHTCARGTRVLMRPSGSERRSGRPEPRNSIPFIRLSYPFRAIRNYGYLVVCEEDIRLPPAFVSLLWQSSGTIKVKMLPAGASIHLPDRRET